MMMIFVSNVSLTSQKKNAKYGGVKERLYVVKAKDSWNWFPEFMIERNKVIFIF